DNLPNCIGDKSMIRQLLTNLLSNAIKYTSTRKSAKIHVSNINLDGESTYTIQDNGVGFSMKYYNRLFSAFERLHNKSEFEGSGIGLSIAHKVIELHHGKIWAESELGKGTTFYFTLNDKRP
ncbi:MAG: ATP-binding protein, partial [Flavobacteriaceae bacterium]|nr:ATP-binding protein [Flavobacteriaceae bacterium]